VALVALGFARRVAMVCSAREESGWKDSSGQMPLDVDGLWPSERIYSLIYLMELETIGGLDKELGKYSLTTELMMATSSGRQLHELDLRG